MRRLQVYYLSRTVICVAGLLSIGTLFIPTPNLFLVVTDILLRTYLVFVGTVMAHEGVHGHLGQNNSDQIAISNSRYDIGRFVNEPIRSGPSSIDRCSSFERF